MTSSSSTVEHALSIALSQPQPAIDDDQYLDSCTAALKQLNAVLVAHYYTDARIQALADATGGCVSDSLEMARFGAESDAQVIVVAGVRFMGETAKILTPDKRVIMPTLEATCSLDIGCPIDEFAAFCDQHPERTVVVYANTSAAVKARADWVVTSSIALDVVDHLDSLGQTILWAPDKYLGHYVQQKTGADMLLWQGSCVVHEEFKASGIQALKAIYPDAAVLVHPESPESVIALADVVGSTSQLIKAAKELPNVHCIVATDRAIFYKMQQAAPGKVLLDAPTGGAGATCRSCAHCPWMAMNSLAQLDQVLQSALAARAQSKLHSIRNAQTWPQEICIDQEVVVKARLPLNRMLDFKQSQT
mgnify:CR=1 FL=1